MNLKDYLQLQEKFSNLFYDKNNMSSKQKEEMLKTLSLSLHSEITQIVSSTNYKFYDKDEFTVDKGKVLYKSVDAFRYLLAILNLYDINEDTFLKAFQHKDNYLHKDVSYRTTNKPVVVVDIDDVLVSFRSTFNQWIRDTYSIEIDDNSNQYYSSIAVKDIGLSPESVFEEFMEEDGLLTIPAFQNASLMTEALQKSGYEIQLLTSRPEGNLKCKYQTLQSLLDNNIVFDKLNFSSEKYIWLAKQDFYLDGRFKFAIDDSPKHVSEYANHNVPVVMPIYEYNKSILDHPKKDEYIFETSLEDMHYRVTHLSIKLK